MSEEVNYPLRLVKHSNGKMEWRDDEPKSQLAAPTGSEKGFVGNGPNPELLKPTPEEREHLRRLLEWQKASARCTTVFGPSINCHCGAVNNPNNQVCHQCGRPL